MIGGATTKTTRRECRIGGATAKTTRRGCRIGGDHLGDINIYLCSRYICSHYDKALEAHVFSTIVHESFEG